MKTYIISDDRKVDIPLTPSQISMLDATERAKYAGVFTIETLGYKGYRRATEIDALIWGLNTLYQCVELSQSDKNFLAYFQKKREMDTDWYSLHSFTKQSIEETITFAKEEILENSFIQTTYPEFYDQINQNAKPPFFRRRKANEIAIKNRSRIKYRPKSFILRPSNIPITEKNAIKSKLTEYDTKYKNCEKGCIKPEQLYQLFWKTATKSGFSKAMLAIRHLSRKYKYLFTEFVFGDIYFELQDIIVDLYKTQLERKPPGYIKWYISI
jgi:hypothetical protein